MKQVLALILFFVAPLCVKANLTSDIYEQFADKVVKIVSSKNLGTGFFISDSLVMTNRHVLFDEAGWYNYPFLVKHDGFRVENISQVICSRRVDICILSLNVLNKSELEQFQKTISNTPDLKVGDEVFTIGHPQGVPWTISKGFVNSSEKYFDSMGHLSQISAAISPGNSGGPLINNEKSIVGVVTLMHTSAASVGYAISKREIFLFTQHVFRGASGGEIFYLDPRESLRMSTSSKTQQQVNSETPDTFSDLKKELESCLVDNKTVEEVQVTFSVNFDRERDERLEEVQQMSFDDEELRECLLKTLQNYDLNELGETEKYVRHQINLRFYLNSNKRAEVWSVFSELPPREKYSNLSLSLGTLLNPISSLEFTDKTGNAIDVDAKAVKVGLSLAGRANFRRTTSSTFHFIEGNLQYVDVGTYSDERFKYDLEMLRLYALAGIGRYVFSSVRLSLLGSVGIGLSEFSKSLNNKEDSETYYGLVARLGVNYEFLIKSHLLFAEVGYSGSYLQNNLDEYISEHGILLSIGKVFR